MLSHFSSLYSLPQTLKIWSYSCVLLGKAVGPWKLFESLLILVLLNTSFSDPSDSSFRDCLLLWLKRDIDFFRAVHVREWIFDMCKQILLLVLENTSWIALKYSAIYPLFSSFDISGKSASTVKESNCQQPRQPLHLFIFIHKGSYFVLHTEDSNRFSLQGKIQTIQGAENISQVLQLGSPWEIMHAIQEVSDLTVTGMEVHIFWPACIVQRAD